MHATPYTEFNCSPHLFQNPLFALVVSASTHHEVQVPRAGAVVCTLLSLDRTESGIDIALVAESALEEPPDAFDVPVEVPKPGRRRAAGSQAPQFSVLGNCMCDNPTALRPPSQTAARGATRRWESAEEERGGHVPFRVLVRRADHLREVDDDRLAGLAADEDVELVEVAMDEPCPCEPYDEVHQVRVQRPRGGQVGHLAAGRPEERKHQSARQSN